MTLANKTIENQEDFRDLMSEIFEDAPFRRLRVDLNGNEVPYGTHPAGGYMECSIPVNATDQHIEEARKSMLAVYKEQMAFDALSREEKLEHYLRLAYKELNKIMEHTGHQKDVRVWLEELKTETPREAELKRLLGDIWCMADMAMVQLPSEFSPRNNKD